MKRLLYLSFIIAVMVICSNTAMAWDYPLEIDVIKVCCNHDTTSTASDGINIMADTSTFIASPEWTPASSKESAYLNSVTSPIVKAEFYCTDTQDFSSVSIYTYKTSGDGSWALDTATATFNPSGSSGFVSMNTKIGCLQPSSVGKNTFTWSWRVLYVDEELLAPPYEIGTTTHTYYKILTSPQDPMKYPWVEVLDYSCDWAEGETIATSAAEEITKGIYEDLGLMYDKEADGPSYGDYETSLFYLTEFLSDIPGSNIPVICYDTGQIVVIFGNAIGCNLTYRVSSRRTYERFGYLNCILPIGLIWTNNPFFDTDDWNENAILSGDYDLSDRSYFSNHAFAAIDTAYNPQHVYDACMKVDTDEDPDDGPPFTESWLTGDNWYVTSGDYNQKVIDNYPTAEYSTGPARQYNITIQ